MWCARVHVACVRCDKRGSAQHGCPGTATTGGGWWPGGSDTKLPQNAVYGTSCWAGRGVLGAELTLMSRLCFTLVWLSGSLGSCSACGAGAGAESRREDRRQVKEEDRKAERRALARAVHTHMHAWHMAHSTQHTALQHRAPCTARHTAHTQPPRHNSPSPHTEPTVGFICLISLPASSSLMLATACWMKP